MPFIATKDRTQIFYKDWGQGQLIVFHHGWPLSSDDWDNQMLFFLRHGMLHLIGATLVQRLRGSLHTDAKP
jgi:pimeloyl-ACP methyl ester carboxylesterase